MKCRKLTCVTALTLFAALAVNVPAWGQENSQPRLIKFDVAGAGTGSGQGTLPFAISPNGTVTGFYCDAVTCHGFLRDPAGAITTFDAPDDTNGTYSQAINPAGAITGYYADVSGVNHGFLRAADGSITTFDVSEAGTGSGQGTFPANINPAGEIAGSYVDASGVNHGFLRDPDGAVITFDVPGAGTGSGQGTVPNFTDCLTPAGAVAGYYMDASGGNHGFVRASDGTITTFDVPGAVEGTGPFQGTKVAGINPAGTISGNWFDAKSATHGFLRAPDGTITKYDVPDAGTGFGQGTVGASINPAGDLVSYWADANSVSHGYLRSPSGVITKFDVPGAGTGAFQGTLPFDNNPSNSVTGFYVDANNVNHGFLLLQ